MPKGDVSKTFFGDNIQLGPEYETNTNARNTHNYSVIYYEN